MIVSGAHTHNHRYHRHHGKVLYLKRKSSLPRILESLKKCIFLITGVAAAPYQIHQSTRSAMVGGKSPQNVPHKIAAFH
jgi:hypothetical protein